VVASEKGNVIFEDSITMSNFAKRLGGSLKIIFTYNSFLFLVWPKKHDGAFIGFSRIFVTLNINI